VQSQLTLELDAESSELVFVGTRVDPRNLEWIAFTLDARLSQSQYSLDRTSYHAGDSGIAVAILPSPFRPDCRHLHKRLNDA